MGGVTQDFSGGLAESPLTQHSQGRVPGSSLVFLGPPVPQGSCCSCLQIGPLGCGSALEHVDEVLLCTKEKPVGPGGKSGKKEPARMELLP